MVPGDEVVLIPNPSYTWGHASLDHDGPTSLEGLTYRFVPDGAARTASLVSGASHFEDDVPPADFVNLDASLIQVKMPQFGSGWALVFNHRQTLTGELAVRRAMQLAMDRQGMIDVVFKGIGAPACSSLTRVVPCHAFALCEGRQTDLERAGRVLEEAGWQDNDGDGIREREGERLSLIYYFRTNATLAQEMAEFLKRNFLEIGIEVNIEGLSDAPYFQEVRNGTHHMQAWWETGVHPDLLRILFHSSNANGGTNRCNYIDEAMDDLLMRAAAASDPLQRCDLYIEIQNKVQEDAIMEFWCDPDLLYAHSDKLTAVVYYHSGNIPYFYAAKLS
jgi:peptide/nickel transport system substrate-binding protein